MGWKITLGCAIFALGFDLFLEPNSLNVGGMSGLAMILRELLGFGSIGVLTMLLNVPLFVLGARKLGKKFLFGSLAGMLLSSAFIDLFAVIPAPKTEILLDSLYGGLLVGLGLGLVFLSGATTGGSDIAAKLLRRRFRSASLGKVLLAIDLFIIFLTGVVFRDISRTLYSALPLAVSSISCSTGWTIPPSRSSSPSTTSRSPSRSRPGSTAARPSLTAAAAIRASRGRSSCRPCVSASCPSSRPSSARSTPTRSSSSCRPIRCWARASAARATSCKEGPA